MVKGGRSSAHDFIFAQGNVDLFVVSTIALGKAKTKMAPANAATVPGPQARVLDKEPPSES